MRFMLYNIVCTDKTSDKTLYRTLDVNLAYGSRIKNRDLITYTNVAIPIKMDNSYVVDEQEFDEFRKLHSNTYMTNQELIKECYIYNFFKTNNMLDCKFTYKYNIEISDDNMDIYYSDGSSQMSIGKASYTSIQLLENTNIDEENSDIYYSEDLERYAPICTRYGIIESGTNNIGELYGVKEGLSQKANKDVLLIISDNEYSIKSFREWIHNWKKNGYVGADKKQIKNLELIKSIEKDINKNNHKIILYKWVKGHLNNTFNNLCDCVAGYLLDDENKLRDKREKPSGLKEVELAQKLIQSENPKVEVGDKLHISFMEGRPDYYNKDGFVNCIDDMGFIHGTWGSLSICPDVDKYYILKE